MTMYDPQIIASMADRMYTEAAWIVARYTLTAAVIGLALGFAVVTMQHGRGPVLGAGLGGILVGALGFIAGTRAALALRFQAQQALVLVEIERNTRARES